MNASGAVELTGDTERVGPWLLEQIGAPSSPDGQRFLGLLSGERVLAGVMYDDFTDASCCMHVAVAHPHVPLRRLIVASFQFPFETWGLSKVFGRVRASNRAALKFDIGLGFKPEAELRDVFAGGESMFVLSMSKAECRWIRSTRYRC